MFMKSFFTIVFLVMLTFSLNGQMTIKKGPHDLHTRVNLRDTRIHPNELAKQGIHSLDRLVRYFKTIQTGNRDVKQKLDSIVYYNYYEKNREWHVTDLDYFIYGENGRITDFYYYEWDSQSTQWENYERDEYAYESGVMTQLIIYLWNSMNEEWNYNSKLLFTYEDGAMTGIVIYTWDWESDDWLYSEKYDMLYDENGQMTEAYYSQWNNGMQQWIAVGKRELIYEDGLLMTDLYSAWNGSSWVEFKKYEYSYNGNDISLEIDYVWNNNQNEWKEDEKYEYFYDDQQNLSEVKYYIFIGSDWLLDGKEECIYNNSYSYSELLLPEFYLGFFADYTDLYFRHMLTSYIEYDWFASGETWIDDYKEELYYSEITVTGQPAEPLQNVQWVYPNPASDRIVFNLPDHSGASTIKMYDTGGQLLLTGEVYDDETMNVSHLQRGLYMYVIETDGTTYSGKLLLK